MLNNIQYIIKKREKMKITKEWLGGFISGEGCFTFTKSYSKYKTFSPIFSITLHAKDIDLLKQIQAFIPIKSSVRTNSEKYNSCTLQIYSHQKCTEFSKFIDNYIIGDKLVDFENWKQGLKALEEEKWSEELFNFINKLRPTMNKDRNIYKYKKFSTFTGRHTCYSCGNNNVLPRNQYCEDCMWHLKFRYKNEFKKTREKGEHFYLWLLKNKITIKRGLNKNVKLRNRS